MKLGKKKHMMKDLKKYSKTYDEILHLIDKTRNDIKIIVMNLMWRNLNVYIQCQKKHVMNINYYNQLNIYNMY